MRSYFGYNNWNKLQFLRWKNGFPIALFGLKWSEMKFQIPIELLKIGNLIDLCIPVSRSTCGLEFCGYRRLIEQIAHALPN